MHLAIINKTYSRLLALVIIVVISIWVWTSKDMLVKQNQIYQVNHGASIGTVAKDLRNKKWINSELFFNSLSKLIGANKKLQSGHYQIYPNMSVMTFLENVSTGNVVTTKVTLIEGKTLNHYFEQLSSDSSLRSEHTLEEVMQSLGIRPPYDGWFYPETYQFNYGESVKNVLARSFQVMQEKVNELWDNRAHNLPFKSPYEAIILASLIEKETALETLKNGKHLEITRFKGLGEISPKEFGQFIGSDMKAVPVGIEHIHEVGELLNFYMGTNTSERRQYIMDNLV